MADQEGKKDSFLAEQAVNLVILICIALAGFSLRQSFLVHGNLSSMETLYQERHKQITKSLEELKNDKEEDYKQNETLSKHWKIVGQTKEAINEDRAKDGRPLFKWDLKD